MPKSIQGCLSAREGRTNVVPFIEGVCKGFLQRVPTRAPNRMRVEDVIRP